MRILLLVEDSIINQIGLFKTSFILILGLWSTVHFTELWEQYVEGVFDVLSSE